MVVDTAYFVIMIVCHLNKVKRWCVPKIIDIDAEKQTVTIQQMDESCQVIAFNQLPCDYSEYLTPPVLLSELSYFVGVFCERAKQKNIGL